MLESIGVDIAFAQRFVRQHIVIKRHQLDVQTVFFFRHFLRDFGDLLFSTDNHADFNMVRIFFILAATHQGQRTDQRSDCRKGFKFERHTISLLSVLVLCDAIYE